MSDTNAVKWLRTQGVTFEVLPYTFTEIGADHAAEAVGRPLEMVCKTLVVKAPGKVFHVAIEESLLALDRIVVNGGRRGVLIELATDDLVRLLNARPANICV